MPDEPQISLPCTQSQRCALIPTGPELIDRHWYRRALCRVVVQRGAVTEGACQRDETNMHTDMETPIFEVIIQSPEPAMPESSTAIISLILLKLV